MKEKLHAEQIRIIEGDALVKVTSLEERFDIIFIDPPFALNFHEKALKIATQRLKPNGLIYVESPKEWQANELLEALNLEILRESTAGAVTYRLLRIREEQP